MYPQGDDVGAIPGVGACVSTTLGAKLGESFAGQYWLGCRMRRKKKSLASIMKSQIGNRNVVLFVPSLLESLVEK